MNMIELSLTLRYRTQLVQEMVRFGCSCLLCEPSLYVPAQVDLFFQQLHLKFRKQYLSGSEAKAKAFLLIIVKKLVINANSK